MTHCEDGEDIASIVFADELDLIRLHEKCISLIESSILYMVAI